MPATTTIEWANPAHTRLQQALNYHTAQLNSWEADFQQFQDAQPEIEDIFRELNPIYQVFQRLADRADILNQYNSQLHHIRDIYITLGGGLQSYAEDSAAQLRSRQRSIDTTRAEIANLRTQLRALGTNNEHTVRKADLAAAINGLPNVVKGSAQVGYTNGDPYIAWTMRGMYMQPLDNHRNALIRGLPGQENRPGTLLTPVRVVINPSDYTVQLRPLRGQRDTQPRYYYGNPRGVHPHIMNDYTPCLGDFGPTVSEMIAAKDWNTVVALLNAFFDRADPHDPAGRTWSEPLIARASQMWPGGAIPLGTSNSKTLYPVPHRNHHYHFRMQEVERGIYELWGWKAAPDVVIPAQDTAERTDTPDIRITESREVIYPNGGPVAEPTPETTLDHPTYTELNAWITEQTNPPRDYALVTVPPEHTIRYIIRRQGSTEYRYVRSEADAHAIAEYLDTRETIIVIPPDQEPELPTRAQLDAWLNGDEALPPRCRRHHTENHTPYVWDHRFTPSRRYVRTEQDQRYVEESFPRVPITAANVIVIPPDQEPEPEHPTYAQLDAWLTRRTNLPLYHYLLTAPPGGTVRYILRQPRGAGYRYVRSEADARVVAEYLGRSETIIVIPEPPAPAHPTRSEFYRLLGSWPEHFLREQGPDGYYYLIDRNTGYAYTEFASVQDYLQRQLQDHPNECLYRYIHLVTP